MTVAVAESHVEYPSVCLFCVDVTLISLKLSSGRFMLPWVTIYSSYRGPVIAGSMGSIKPGTRQFGEEVTETNVGEVYHFSKKMQSYKEY